MLNTVLLLVFTIFSLSSFIAIFVGSDPYSASLFIKVLFFLTLFFSLIGVFSILGVWVSRFGGRLSAFDVIFRRSMLLAVLALSLILLETFSALNIINTSATLLLIVSTELLFVHRKVNESK